MKDKKTILSFVQFLLGVVFALAFLTLLKFQNPMENIWTFALCLMGMHTGIIFFILSKKSFRRGGIDIKKHYHDVMFYLLLFVPVLIYKFIISNIWKSTWMGDSAYLTLTLTIAAVVLILSIRSAIHLYKDIVKGVLHTDEPYEPKPNLFVRLFSKKTAESSAEPESSEE